MGFLRIQVERRALPEGLQLPNEARYKLFKKRVTSSTVRYGWRIFLGKELRERKENKIVRLEPALQRGGMVPSGRCLREPESWGSAVC